MYFAIAMTARVAAIVEQMRKDGVCGFSRARADFAASMMVQIMCMQMMGEVGWSISFAMFCERRGRGSTFRGERRSV